MNNWFVLAKSPINNRIIQRLRVTNQQIKAQAIPVRYICCVCFLWQTCVKHKADKDIQTSQRHEADKDEQTTRMTKTDDMNMNDH